MYVIFAKFHNDWVKIVDFLVKAYFWGSADLSATPGTSPVVIGAAVQHQKFDSLYGTAAVQHQYFQLLKGI